MEVSKKVGAGFCEPASGQLIDDLPPASFSTSAKAPHGLTVLFPDRVSALLRGQ